MSYRLLGLGFLTFLFARQAAAGPYTVWGAGTDPCEMYVQEYDCCREGPDGGRFRMEISWVAGFVTEGNGEMVVTMARTLGKEGASKGDILKGMDAAASEAWLARYCEAHPTEHLVDAATKLEAYLLGRLENRLKR